MTSRTNKNCSDTNAVHVSKESDALYSHHHVVSNSSPLDTHTNPVCRHESKTGIQSLIPISRQEAQINSIASLPVDSRTTNTVDNPNPASPVMTVSPKKLPPFKVAQPKFTIFNLEGLTRKPSHTVSIPNMTCVNRDPCSSESSQLEAKRIGITREKTSEGGHWTTTCSREKNSSREDEGKDMGSHRDMTFVSTAAGPSSLPLTSTSCLDSLCFPSKMPVLSARLACVTLDQHENGEDKVSLNHNQAKHTLPFSYSGSFTEKMLDRSKSSPSLTEKRIANNNLFQNHDSLSIKTSTLQDVVKKEVASYPVSSLASVEQQSKVAAGFPTPSLLESRQESVYNRSRKPWIESLARSNKSNINAFNGGPKTSAHHALFSNYTANYSANNTPNKSRAVTSKTTSIANVVGKDVGVTTTSFTPNSTVITSPASLPSKRVVSGQQRQLPLLSLEKNNNKEHQQSSSSSQSKWSHAYLPSYLPSKQEIKWSSRQVSKMNPKTTHGNQRTLISRDDKVGGAIQQDKNKKMTAPTATFDDLIDEEEDEVGGIL